MSNQPELFSKCCPICYYDCRYEGDILGHHFTCLKCGTLTIIQAYNSKETALRMIYGRLEPPSEPESYKKARGILSNE